MMEQLSLYIPGIMGLAFALVAFLSVRRIAGNRPVVRHTVNEEGQERFPFEERAKPKQETAETVIRRVLGLETTH